MANTTIGFGAALIALGLAGYFGTGADSPTALIPALFGGLLVVLGGMARDPGKRKLAMHIAAAVALLGILGSIRGLAQLPALLSGQAVARPVAVVAQSFMAVLMGWFLGLCIRSFMEARRARIG